MSPLARRLQAEQQAGTSYREMERVAWDKAKVRFGSSSFEQVAKDQRADRLTSDAIKAVATVLGISEREVADLDDERWGIRRDYVARGPSPQDESEVIANASTDKLLAEIARRAGEGNPNR